MDNLIDKTYFTKQLAISGLDEVDSDNEVKLNGFIEEYQDEFISRCFGGGLTTEQIETLIPYFVFDDKCISPFANYIYCIYMEDDSHTTTNAGVLDMSIQSTTSADYRVKVVKAWNNMVKMIQDIHNVLYSEITVGSGGSVVNYLNDIMYNVPACIDYIERNNRTNGIYLKGGIFNTKTIHDYNKYDPNEGVK